MKTVLLGDIVRCMMGASPRPIQDYIQNQPGVPWIKIADATAANSRFIRKTKDFIKESGENKSVKVTPETLIMSNSATPGLPMIVKINACVHDGWLILDKLNGVDRDWLYYYLLRRREESSREASGSLFSNLKTDIVRNFKVNLPELATQKNVAAILWTIDEKIELNRQMNEALEQIGQTLFKHNFIDNPEARLVPIIDIINFAKGIEPGSKNYTEHQTDSNVAFLRVGDMGSRKNEIYVEKMLLKDRIVEANDILVSFDGAPGLVSVGLKGGYSTGIQKLSPKQPDITNGYIF